MKFVLALLGVGLIATSCAPGDPTAKNAHDRVLAGETVTFDKPGYGLCGKSFWTDMRLCDASERERIVVGKSKTVVSPGHSVCYRIGDVVDLTVCDRQIPQAGRVQINRISLALLDKIHDNQFKGSYFSADTIDKYKSALKARMKPDQEGIVSIVDVTYLPGSAADEAALKQKATDDDAGDGYAETKADGDFLPRSRCDKPYTYIPIPADAADEFTSGKLHSWYELGDKSCLRQGDVVDLSPGKGLPATAKAKILKVKKFKTKFLARKYFNSDDDFQAIKDRMAKDKASDWVLVIDFAVQTDGDQK